MAGDLGPARHVMRCRLLRGDDVLMMAPCQCVLSSRSGRMGAADYLESLQKAMQQEIRLERVPNAAWDPELNHDAREEARGL